jgi:hypothetical protein
MGRRGRATEDAVFGRARRLPVRAAVRGVDDAVFGGEKGLEAAVGGEREQDLAGRTRGEAAREHPLLAGVVAAEEPSSAAA